MSLHVSLEQWRTLVAVVDAGGYAQAAARLHKTQSSISYAIQQIEDRLSVVIFQIEGRKAELTETGRVLYRRAKALGEEAERIERTAGKLAQGREPLVSLAVESLFPIGLLLDSMERFSQEVPDTRIELYESVMGGTDELLSERQVDLAICADTIPAGFAGDFLMPYRAVAVAAPSHPLHHLKRNPVLDDLRGHTHLIIRDSGTRRTREGAWDVAEQRWTVSHRTTSIRAACMGIGFAWYAEDWIQDKLRTGQLAQLRLTEGAERRGALYLVYSDPDGAGPSARRLADIIRENAAKPA
ncbi:LysR family transcriptional regulator [Bradyrhizobium uaiense]|uniref:LysR family transcriptional regulator n=1 Tax=Bradyrhizobium uaiense TaxID=2594946 RepID=A0A6P1BES0_9BRAD|nr:LysR family transcriptional regulator [Bradyrhizobium uaiense]NEU96769.1 LysR family transcriptional regulator [Bradyrhizobium uaiense]